MPAMICAAHMHPLPCPGYACRTTSDPAFVSVMEEYRADVAAEKLPPWIWELRHALQKGHAWLRGHAGDKYFTGRSREDVDACIADLRRAGWVGEDQTIWSAATSMSQFTGAMPGLPQRACEDREVWLWRQSRGGRRG